MRTSYLLVLLIIGGGTATAIGKSLLEPSDPYEKQERLLADYRANPEATLKKISAAFVACTDTIYGNRPAAAEIRDLAARLMLEAIDQRAQNVDEVDRKKRAVQLMERQLPAVKAKVADHEVDELLAYMRALGEDGVPSCVVSST